MKDNISSPTPPLRVLLISLACLVGCHDSIEVGESSSAGAPEDFDEAIPCVDSRQGPDAWRYHTCTGKIGGFVRFEYHGDPDLPVDSFVLCVESNPEAKPASYQYDCWLHMASLDFTDGIAEDYLDEVGVCCRENTDEDVAGDHCSESVAVEICRANVSLLDDLRREIPHSGLAGELYNQLTALNYHIAEPEAQASCSGLLHEGLDEAAKATWKVEDSPVEWPWIRNLRLVTEDYDLEFAERSDFTCGEQRAKSQGAGPGSLWDCALAGDLVLAAGDRSAAGRVAGRAVIEATACTAEPCRIELAALSLETHAFDSTLNSNSHYNYNNNSSYNYKNGAASGALGWPLLLGDPTGAGPAPFEWSFLGGSLGGPAGPTAELTGLQATLRSPVSGRLTGGQLRIPAAGLYFDASLELEAGASVAIDPAGGQPEARPQTVHTELRPENALVGAFDQATGELRFAPMTTRNWPIASELRDLRGTCEPRE